MVEYESKYESRFSYIEDKNLRKHMGDALEFISDILAYSLSVDDSRKNYIHKTCIIYVASIIESQIHYCIIKLGFIESENKNWTYKSTKVLYEDSTTDTVVFSATKVKEKIDMTGNIDFNLLNMFAYKKAGIYDEEMYKKIEKIRKLRNQIHLMKLSDLDRKYSKRKLDEIFSTSRDLFKIIEKKLKTI